MRGNVNYINAELISMSDISLIPSEHIENQILIIQGQKVILDMALARLYKVSTGRLNEQVKRNRRRFLEDFMFQLTSEEVSILKSRFAISSSGHGGSRHLPHAFTEHGVLMAANVLPTAALYFFESSVSV